MNKIVIDVEFYVLKLNDVWMLNYYIFFVKLIWTIVQ